ncbi:MAG: dTDP-4-dehydrorhamnose 3,5-epimerase [Rhodospirillales bacterium]|nr:dTDP-4-dehydrorhamnose 3,5-epimerase [Rhodospirillales bacterium]
MKISPTRIPGVMLVEAEANTDDRGLFARTYDSAAFAEAGLPTDWPQCNTSWNARRGTLRGMHFQADPKPEPKLVRCTRGAVFDVAVDLRSDSSSYCGWIGVELTADARNALYIPPGCAHGFLTLEDGAEVFYQMGESYVSELARGVRWDDPAFAVDWPFAPTVIGERDAAYPDFLR